ncbi:HdeD family acid-resistance protein [Robertkochia flava]|uniref:HdeD family acid-resistance protein n=1 Tax=Robertkochia flava TaxID=3447986 RepID=UPI001CCE027F|nr:HdeD family acid-resistance protein [Robertkochia marina]
MLKSLANSWKTLVFKGILLIILAIIAFANPMATAASIVMWIAILIAIDGVVTIVTAISQWKERSDKWRFLLEGVLGLIVGLALLLTPGITLYFIGMFIAFWFVFIGINRIMMGIRLRKEIEGEGWVIFNGVLSLILGIAIAAQPFLGVSTLIWFLGFAFLISGIALLVLGFKLRKGKNKIADKLEDLKGNIQSEMSES